MPCDRDSVGEEQTALTAIVFAAVSPAAVAATIGGGATGPGASQSPLPLDILMNASGGQPVRVSPFLRELRTIDGVSPSATIRGIAAVDDGPRRRDLFPAITKSLDVLSHDRRRLMP